MTYRETFELAADAERIFDTLLDARQLTRWLAEHATVEPHKGGTYRFWGRDVIWCADEDESEGEILELDRPRRLVFGWRWKGHVSRVAFDVEACEQREKGGAREGRCRLSVEHRFETFDPGPDVAGCHWRIAIGNLIQVLATGRASLRPDYTVRARTGAQRVELEIQIGAPPERVFRALLDPGQVRQWMRAEAPEIDVDAARYSYGWRRGDDAAEVGPVRLLELVPDRLLVHDWQWTGEATGQVRWELTPIDSGTRLRLIHVESTDLTHGLGWSDALIAIRRLVETSAV